VLAARIDAVRRRGGLTRATDPSPDFQSGALALWYRPQVARVDGEPLRLTPIEYKLLCELVRRAGEVVPSQVVLDRVWAWGPFRSRRLPSVHEHLQDTRGCRRGTDRRLLAHPSD
jgi:DNA-binding response OmpR family regulator